MNSKNNKLKTYIIVNPMSANKSTSKKWSDLKKIIEYKLGDFKYALTTGIGHATEISRHALMNGYERIISIGGDGTNNEVINGFFDKGKPINSEAVFSLINMGTGGDFRRTLALPKSAEECINALAFGNVMSCDIGKLTFVNYSDEETVRYFINIASFGLGGLVDKTVNSTTKAFGGKASFMIGSIRAFLMYTNKKVTIKIDDKEVIDKKINNVVVANGCYFGGGMYVAPHAKIDDGLFDVLIIGDLRTKESYSLLKNIYTGNHLKLDHVQNIKAKKLTAESNEEVLLDVDGEQPGKLPATFEIIPSAIKVAY